MILFSWWTKFKELLHAHEKVLWWIHSTWAFTFGILVIIFFHGDFGQVKKLTMYLMALLLLLIVFDRIGAWEQRSGRQQRGVKLILNYFMKNMYQGLYFFMIPFYWEASVLSSPSVIFTVVVGLMAILSTQDLIFDNWLMEKKLLRAGYYSLCLFASFNLLLPLFLPLPGQYTLPLAAFLAVLGFVVLHYPRWLFKKGHLRWVLLGGALVAGGCYGIRGFIPPTPLKVSQTTLTARAPSRGDLPRGDGVYRIHRLDMENREIYCVHVLESPVNPRDRFLHEWRMDGKIVTKKPLRKLKISGDRYLIWSSIRHTETGAVNLAGDWNVRLLTGGGQILKKRSFLVVE